MEISFQDVVFKHDNHEIKVCRVKGNLQLSVDGNVIATKEGNWFANQIIDAELSGVIKNDDNSENKVLVKVKMGNFLDYVTLFYNEEEIETKRYFGF